MQNYTDFSQQYTNRILTETPAYEIESKSNNETMSVFHYHTKYELDYIASATRTYYIEDKLFTVNAGMFLLIPPYKYHCAKGPRSNRTLIMFSTEFLLKFFTPTAVRNFISCFNKTMVYPPKELQAQCHSLLEYLKKCNNDTDSAIYLAALLLELSKCPSVETQTTTPISHITDYINKNFGQITAIEQIADYFFISKYHLCHTFKKHMDITIIDYLNNTKIRNACKYLESTDKDILEISQICGFNSSAYFCNVFKKVTALSPSKYRKLYKKESEQGFLS